MTEETFKEQEQLCKQAEEKVEALKQGKPLQGTVEEFFQLFLPKLNEAPLLQEYIKREHRENQAVIKALREYYERRLSEQDSAIDTLKNDVATLRGDFAEFKDNSNYFMNQFLEQQRQHKDRVRQTLDRIDNALSV